MTPVSLLPGESKQQKKRRKGREKVVAWAALVLVAALIGVTVFRPAKKSDLRIASMDFSENEILAYMLSEAIETKLGLSVDTVLDLGGSSVCVTAINSGEIDGYIEYTGTIYVSILDQPAISDVEKVYEDSKAGMRELYGLEVLNSLNVNNTYTLSTTREIADKYGLETISDLRKWNGQLRATTTLTFLNREDGLPGVKELYGLEFASETGVDGAPRYTALMSGEGDLIDAYSTDGLLKKFELVVLEDDLGAFPPYYAVPVFRGEIMEQYPEIGEVSQALGDVLTTDRMAELNYLVDEEDQNPRDVAHNFLVEYAPELAGV